MFTNGNQNPGSYLYIADNSEISLKFSIGTEILRKEKLGNSRFGFRVFSSSERANNLKSAIYTEMAFFKDFRTKTNSIEVIELQSGKEMNVETLKMKIPFEKQDFEIQIRPQGDGKTKITVKDIKEGTIVGTELIGFVLFPKNNFLNTKIELGNQIEQIDINDYGIKCTKCAILE
jgi:hypothetical protein